MPNWQQRLPLLGCIEGIEYTEKFVKQLGSYNIISSLAKWQPPGGILKTALNCFRKVLVMVIDGYG